MTAKLQLRLQAFVSQWVDEGGLSVGCLDELLCIHLNNLKFFP